MLLKRVRMCRHMHGIAYFDLCPMQLYARHVGRLGMSRLSTGCHMSDQAQQTFGISRICVASCFDVGKLPVAADDKGRICLHKFCMRALASLP